jgi:hypothetical protein
MHQCIFSRIDVAARNDIQHAGDIFARKHDLRETQTFCGILFVAVEACGNYAVMSKDMPLWMVAATKGSKAKKDDFLI